jgi:hypothetical protein
MHRPATERAQQVSSDWYSASYLVWNMCQVPPFIWLCRSSDARIARFDSEAFLLCCIAEFES